MNINAAKQEGAGLSSESETCGRRSTVQMRPNTPFSSPIDGSGAPQPPLFVVRNQMVKESAATAEPPPHVRSEAHRGSHCGSPRGLRVCVVHALRKEPFEERNKLRRRLRFDTMNTFIIFTESKIYFQVLSFDGGFLRRAVDIGRPLTDCS